MKRTGIRRTKFKPSSRTRERKRQELRLDAMCRDLVMQRDKFQCVRCGWLCPGIGTNKQGFRSYLGLDWSHFIGRGRRALRWDPDNSMAHCRRCHRRWHDGRFVAEEHEWFRAEYPKRHAIMLARSQARGGKLDLKLQALFLERSCMMAGIEPAGQL